MSRSGPAQELRAELSRQVAIVSRGLGVRGPTKRGRSLGNGLVVQSNGSSRVAAAGYFTSRPLRVLMTFLKMLMSCCS